jgi:hypothetical protein
MSGYPTVDVRFLQKAITKSKQVEDTIKVGNTTAYVLKGSKAIFKRTIFVATLEGNVVDFNCATGIAIRLNFMGDLLEWLRDNRGWMDGGPFLQPPQGQA